MSNRAYQRDTAFPEPDQFIHDPPAESVFCRLTGGPRDGGMQFIRMNGTAQVGMDIYLEFSIGSRTHVYRMYRPWNGSAAVVLRHFDVRGEG